MNKEIKEILDDITENKEDYYVGTNGCLYQDLTKKELLSIKNYITNLQQERYFYMNIVEELKRYANEEISEGNKMPEEYKRYGIEKYVKGQVAAYKHILSKLEELEKGSNNEK